jgi:hypothetical protein
MLSRIPIFIDPGGGKNCSTFFCSHKYDKIKIYFISILVQEKIWPNLQRIVVVFTKKVGLKIQGPKRHRISDPDPQHRYGSGGINNLYLTRF